MGGRGKAAHVEPDFGEDDLCGQSFYARVSLSDFCCFFGLRIDGSIGELASAPMEIAARPIASDGGAEAADPSRGRSSRP